MQVEPALVLPGAGERSSRFPDVKAETLGLTVMAAVNEAREISRSRTLGRVAPEDENGRSAEEHLIASWDGDDGDGTGRLTITACSFGFAGRGWAWFGREIVLNFAEQLAAAFPIPGDGSVSLSGGHGVGQDFTEHVGIAVLPLGQRGQVDVRLHLANEVWPGDPPEGSYETRMHLLTTYPELSRFATGLRSVVNGTLRSAVLLGDRMA